MKYAESCQFYQCLWPSPGARKLGWAPFLSQCHLKNIQEKLDRDQTWACINVLWPLYPKPGQRHHYN